MKILICDTWGEDVASRIKRMFPFAEFAVVGGKNYMRHPHGHMVAERFLSGYAQGHAEVFGALNPGKVEIDFFPFLEVQEEDPLSWAKMLAAKEYDACICSWGENVPDLLNRAFRKADFLQSEEYQELQELIGETPVFFASGNSDDSRRGKPDIGNDLNFLQYCLATELENVLIIGSCDSEGRPSTFSSDGWVDVAYRGEQIYVWNPLTNRQQTVQGTSFANPEAAGDVLGRGMRLPGEFQAYWRARATTHPGWPNDIMHPKVGHGVMLFGDQVSTDKPSWHDALALTI